MSILTIPEDIINLTLDYLDEIDLNSFLITSKEIKKTHGRRAHNIAWERLIITNPKLKIIPGLASDIGAKKIIVSFKLFILVFKNTETTDHVNSSVLAFLQRLGVLSQSGEFDRNGELRDGNNVLIRSLRRDSTIYQLYEGEVFLSTLNIIGRTAIMCVLEETFLKDISRWTYYDCITSLVYSTDSVVSTSKLYNKNKFDSFYSL